ncbi:hypothetical protein CYLTODRAFT_451650 [Cylindrobasidium torrendii FP15055 ss-10]|uniref:F-box domain-containing protein n=1 Tax=Cylindrobasidium torrendii FP15055 ss-10 TaxID=1314674 RepID=A0A0D7BLJ7_9AGAR|nr:hypothetical protein CYLTODRAFT_451650 [Cylindrobasidium torrendii FP15055 ss-10]
MPSLPLELEAEIFELAGRAQVKEIPRLMLVARRVHYWLEPILYACVIIGGNYATSNPDASLDCNVFNRTRYPRGVKRLCLTFHAKPEPSLPFMRHCKDIQSLACWCPSQEAVDLIPTFRALHTLSISADKFKALPGMPTLTRLELIVLEPLSNFDISMHPNITHLGFLDFPGKSTYSFVPRLLRDELKLLYVLYYYWTDEMEMDLWARDSRVVLMSRTEVKYNALLTWREDTLWDAAEKKRDAKRARPKPAIRACL